MANETAQFSAMTEGMVEDWQIIARANSLAKRQFSVKSVWTGRANNFMEIASSPVSLTTVRSSFAKVVM